MDGFLQENGPFLWQSGTYKPQPNPFAWTNLTNMVWVDQPAGMFLSQMSRTTADQLQELASAPPTTVR
jgi:carboxypeptidase D